MHHDELLLAATILLSASIVAVVLFQRAGFGSVLGLLIAGVVVGPSGLAITDQTETLRAIAEIGIASCFLSSVWRWSPAGFGVCDVRSSVSAFAR